MPERPKEAQEPDLADPGKMAEIKAEQAKKEKQEFGSTKVDTSSSSEDETTEDDSDWIGIQLKDEQGNPIPDQLYKIKLPDGTIIEGYLNSEGKAEIKGIPQGQCEVCFPEIDEDQWRPA